MKHFMLVCTLLFKGILISQTQNIISSNAYIQTCIDKSQCFSINNSAYLFYDEPKSAFYLKLDFAKFKAGEDTLDDWLDDLSSTFLYLKLPLEKEAFQGGLSNNNSKVYKINGQVFLNGIWRTEFVELVLNGSEASILSPGSGTNSYNSVKASFSLVLSPKNYKIHKKAHHLKKTIFIGVHSGRINLIQDNMFRVLGEAYDH